MSDTKNEGLLIGDRPIQEASEDRFGREGFAKRLAKQILALPPKDSHVIGLFGEWGSGKTSVINLASRVLREGKATVIHFNPWLFSGIEQLTASFFKEVAAQIGEGHDASLASLSEKLNSYGDSISGIKNLLSYAPFVGPVVDASAEVLKSAGKVAAAASGGLRGSVYEQRKKLEEALRAQASRIVVIIDDLDRLEQAEIREVVRLVRLTADFPNVTYLLAFDHDRISRALGEDPTDGAAYLEKIVQVSFEVPRLNATAINRFFLDQLNAVLADLDIGKINVTEFGNVFHQVIAPLLQTPRDVRRVTNVLPFAFELLSGEVNAIDVIALETVRVLLPAAFRVLPSLSNPLTSTLEHSQSRHDEASPLQPLFDTAPAHRETLKNLCSRLFPASRRYIDHHSYGHEWTSQWRRNCRVAHADVFRFYFEQTLGSEGLSAILVERAFNALASPEELARILEPLTATQLENLLDRLVDYREEFPPEAAAAALPLIYGVADRLREGRGAGVFDLGADTAVGRLVFRLVRKVPPADRVAAVQGVLSRTPSFTWRQALLRICGYEDDGGQKLIDPALVLQFESELQSQLLQATMQQLRKERDLWTLYRWMLSRTQPPDAVTRWLRMACQDDETLFVLLRSATTTSTSVIVGDSAGKTVSMLQWEFLLAALGEPRLQQLASVRTEELPPGNAAARSLVEAYLAGRRPEEHDAPGNDQKRREAMTAVMAIQVGLAQERLSAFTMLSGLSRDDWPRAANDVLTSRAKDANFPIEEREAASMLLGLEPPTPATGHAATGDEASSTALDGLEPDSVPSL